MCDVRSSSQFSQTEVEMFHNPDYSYVLYGIPSQGCDLFHKCGHLQTKFCSLHLIIHMSRDKARYRVFECFYSVFKKVNSQICDSL